MDGNLLKNHVQRNGKFHLLIFASAVILATLVICFVLGQSASATTTPENDPTGIQPVITRIEGSNGEATGTSAEIALKVCEAADSTADVPKYNDTETIVLARSDDFADSMSATGLAGVLEAPILLTDTDELSDTAKTTIETLHPKNIYIIGGTSAVSAGVEEAVKNLGGIENVKRVWGEEYYDTSVECANEIKEVAAQKNVEFSGDVIVAYGQNFQDALSMSSFAYRYNVPILLTTPGNSANERNLTNEQQQAIKSMSTSASTVYVPGGTGAVSDSTLANVQSSASQVKRIWGETGFDTSNEIARYFTSSEGGNKLSASTTVIANGAYPPKGQDALCGSALAGKNSGVILLASPASSTTTIDSFLTSEAKQVSEAYILGGTSVMPVSIIDKVKNVLWNWNKVDFNSNEGSSVDSQKVWTGDKAAKPNPDPARENYTFTGWYADSEFKTAFYFDNAITASTTVYAKFTPEEYKITYNLDEGTNAAANPTTYTIETDTIALQPATKEGYIFNGWFKESTFETQVTEIEKGSTGNVELYAKFTRDIKPIAEQTITVEGNFTYNGSEQTPTLTVKDAKTGAALTENTDYTVVYKQGSTEVTSPKDAGTYTVVITAASGSKYTGSDETHTFDIAKATPTLSGNMYAAEGETLAKIAKPTVLGVDGKTALSGTLVFDENSTTAVGAGSLSGTKVEHKMTYTPTTEEATNYSELKNVAQNVTVFKASGFWLSDTTTAAGRSADETTCKSSSSYKNASKIKADAASIKDASATNHSTVETEYKKYMKVDNVHLYTTYTGDSNAIDANAFVEFRVIQVGEHTSALKGAIVDGATLEADLTDGSALTFHAVHSLPTAYKMNENESTNVGGWTSTTLRPLLQSAGTIFNHFNTNFTSAINDTIKTYNTGDGVYETASTEVKKTTDKFFLLSYSELVNNDSSTYVDFAPAVNTEGVQYTYYNNKVVGNASNNSIKDIYKTREDKAAFDAYDNFWWLRSPYATTDGTFMVVYSNGKPYYNNGHPNRCFGVAPAFCF